MGRYENKYNFETAKEFVELCGCKLLSSNYYGMNIKHEFECKCGNNFTTTFAKFQNRNKRQCNKCGRKDTPQTKPSDIKDINEYFNSFGCELISKDYKNCYTSLLAVCKCGKEFETSYNRFKNSKYQCQECSQRDSNEFKCKYSYEYIYDLLKQNGEELLTPKTSDYIIRKSEIEIKCSCGEVYTTQLEIILTYNKYCCNECSFKNAPMSKGELKIQEYFNDNNINYHPQYQIKECKCKYVLRFDFAILENEKLLYLCEFDGIQHYKPFDYFGGIDTYNKIVERDKIKNDYCNDNHIKLLRIPYYEFDNINEILKNSLTESNLGNEVAFSM